MRKVSYFQLLGERIICERRNKGEPSLAGRQGYALPLLILPYVQNQYLLNAKGNPDGFLSHYPSFRGYKSKQLPWERPPET